MHRSAQRHRVSYLRSLPMEKTMKVLGFNRSIMLALVKAVCSPYFKHSTWGVDRMYEHGLQCSGGFTSVCEFWPIMLGDHLRSSEISLEGKCTYPSSGLSQILGRVHGIEGPSRCRNYPLRPLRYKLPLDVSITSLLHWYGTYGTVLPTRPTHPRIRIDNHPSHHARLTMCPLSLPCGFSGLVR